MARVHERVQFTLVGLFPGFTFAENFPELIPETRREERKAFSKGNCQVQSASLSQTNQISFSFPFSFSFLFLFPFRFLVLFLLSLSLSLSLSLFPFLFLFFFLLLLYTFSNYTFSEKLKVEMVTQSTCWTLFTTRTSSTAQCGGGSFKNRKPIGEVGFCESGMAERSH